MRLRALALAVCFATPLHAEDIKLTSRIDAVTVFPRGGEVVRTATAKISRGEHIVVFSDLPAGTDLNSIRVEGKATGALQIGAVDSKRVQVLSDDDAALTSQRRKLEEALEQEQDRLSALEAAIETKEIQKRYLENLAGLPTVGAPLGGQRAAQQQDWSELLRLIGTSLADVQQSILTQRIKVRQSNRRIEDLQKQLSELAAKPKRRTEVRISIAADEELSAEFAIRYQIGNARWTPLYDARLETGSRNVPAKLELTRRASITQWSGEPWEDVVVSLSTARPSGRTAAPSIYPVKVDFQRPRPAPTAVLRSEAAEDRAQTRRLRQPRSAAKARPAAGLLAPAVERDAGVDAAGYQATFKVPGRLSVSNSGTAKRVKISTIAVEPALVVRSVPKSDARAYLYAKLSIPNGEAALLRGQVMLFRDQTFVGRGRLPQLAAGEKHELGFGPDDAVRIKYSKIGEERGESGIISSSETDQRKFKIMIKNLRERPISYTILDQRPQSLNEDIKVEWVGRARPSRENVKDRPGVVAWDGKLAPGEEKVLDFGYQVSWPAGKQIEYRR